MTAYQEIQLVLDIPAEDYLRYYEGTAKNIQTYSVDGRTVRFPARVLRPFLTHAGIRGRFVLHCDDENRFVRIDRLD